MATWVLTATNLPITSAPNGALEGDISLSGAMPIDFDPDGITEIRLARTLSVSGIVDDTVNDTRGVQLKNGNGQSVASWFDAEIPRNTSGSWEFARTFTPPFTNAPTAEGNFLTPPTALWSSYASNMKADGAVTSITAATVEIDYVPIVPEAPTVSLTASETDVQTGVEVTVTATATGAPAPTLTWDRAGTADGPESTATSKVLKWSTPGVKTVTVTATNGSGSAQDSVQITVAARAPLADFKDDFSTLNMSKWRASGTFDASTGRAVATIDGVFYAWAQTEEIYDVRNSEIIVQAGAPDAGSGGREHTLSIGFGGWTRAVKLVHIGDGILAMTTVDSTNTVVAESYSLPPVAWWRIRFTDTTAIFGWSADRLDWFDFHTTTLDWLATPVRVEIATGAWQAEGTFSAWWDNINTLPAPSVDAVKVWNGTSFKVPQGVWNGTRFRADAKIWNGTSWQPMSS